MPVAISTEKSFSVVYNIWKKLYILSNLYYNYIHLQVIIITLFECANHSYLSEACSKLIRSSPQYS